MVFLTIILFVCLLLSLFCFLELVKYDFSHLMTIF